MTRAVLKKSSRAAKIFGVSSTARLRRTAENRSSMLQDMLAGRQTEIDHINGAVARLGDSPVNRTLCDLVRALERTHAERQG